MTDRITDEGIEIIDRGYKVGNGPGAFFLRPVLKTVFGCVWSRDRQNWYAPDKETRDKAQGITTTLEDILVAELSPDQFALVRDLLPNRDK